MTPWKDGERHRISTAEELEISSRRTDGSLRPYIIIWCVAVDGEVFVRSANGPRNPWFRRAVASGSGRIRAGGVEADVDFEPQPTTEALHSSIDTAYHRKYDRYGPQIVGSVVGPTAASATLRLVPIEA